MTEKLNFIKISCVSNLESTPCVSNLENTPCVSNLENTPCISNLESTPCVSYLENTSCVSNLESTPSGGFRGGARAMALGLALFMPKKGLALPPPPPPPSICQNVQKYSVKCLKVVPGVPKMVLMRSKSKNIHPYLQKQPVRYVPKLFQMATKWPELDQNLKIFSAPQTPSCSRRSHAGPAYKKWPRAPKFENRHWSEYPLCK